MERLPEEARVEENYNQIDTIEQTHDNTKTCTFLHIRNNQYRLSSC
ncbi:hypothetical protein BURPS305_0033 [Burkholderia pseudomallei 305]|nr:hypothetical protein BURPS305_0033 [Burkholderia pseudomallei 305]